MLVGGHELEAVALAGGRDSLLPQLERFGAGVGEGLTECLGCVAQRSEADVAQRASLAGLRGANSDAQGVIIAECGAPKASRYTR